MAAMFEDSGSEQESQKEIITMVDRIIEENEKADETNNEGAVVDISISRLMLLLHQNLAMTNETRQKIKSLEECQSEMLRRIKELVNSVVNMTSQDVPEQHELLLTLFTPGIPEQPQLELSLKCSQNVCQQNVSPGFSFNLPGQPQQGNQILP